jgi:hypothetical protein
MNQLALLGYDLFGEPVNPEPSRPFAVRAKNRVNGSAFIAFGAS